MDSDGSPQRLVQSYMEFPVSIDCIALHTHKTGYKGLSREDF